MTLEPRRASPHGRASSTVAGWTVEFERVPGTGHHLSLPDPRQFPVGVRAVIDRSRNASFAQRPTLVGAQVGQAVERAADVEDPDLAIRRAHDPVMPVR